MDKVTLLPYESIYENFIDKKYLKDGHDEYFFRNQQVKKPENGWRHLRSDEIERLVKNNNTATSWDTILVTDDFDTNLVKNNRFYGMVRIGAIKRVVLQYHDLKMACGITGSTIISCDIGDYVAIHGVRYMANYIVGDRCILFNIHEVSCTDHSKFGNGIIKDGEPEDVRVWLELMNEAGGRKVLPFDGMITADAYLWAKYTDIQKLQDRLFEITNKEHDSSRGYYGTIGEGCVIKNSWIIKDAKIGSCCYIKGASKLKNITINSSEEEPTQIGEGVILVNGIVGVGCHIFYSVVATRFVIGDNCNLKYGARVIYSILGDNSTISCCEVLNNLIFPAHEQHHNNSFLIAACVMGQSNMAAGATLGSNHNSRATDGEIVAKRGFWPGLCSSVKHSSQFASFTLLSKADYPNEMNIKLPFALVNNNVAKDQLEVMPAYWWMYNMYAIARNTSKYQKRDKRLRRIQNIEFETFAPDTMEEVIAGRKLLEVWTAKAYLRSKGENPEREYYELRELGNKLLNGDKAVVKGLEVLGEEMEKSHRKVVILKPYEAYHAYEDMIIYYSVKNLIYHMEIHPKETFEQMCKRLTNVRQREWINLGGQLVTGDDLEKLIDDICDGTLDSWDDIHKRYNDLWKKYQTDKLLHSYQALRFIYNKCPSLTKEIFSDALDKGEKVLQYVRDQVYESRKKDYENVIRNSTFRNLEERDAVNGKLEDNSFVKQIKKETDQALQFIKDARELIK